MDNKFFSIGEVARASGLSVSALRFYDREGVLTPARVDPITAYRWYSAAQVDDARLVASLRRVGLAVPEITTILAHRGDWSVLRDLLSQHVAHLEAGLAAAKTEIGRIESRWDVATVRTSSITVDASELARALSSVRFAIGSDADYPALHGVLLEVSGQHLRLSATDRHRAAFCEIEAKSDGRAFRAVLSEPGLDDLERLLRDDGAVCLTLNGGLHANLGGCAAACPVLEVDFPDLGHVVQRSVIAASAEVDRGWLREALGQTSEVQQWVLGVDDRGKVTLAADIATAGDHDLLLNAEFLSQAVEAVGGEQLRLEVCGPIAPLAIRRVDDPRTYSVLMPIRRDSS